MHNSAAVTAREKDLSIAAAFLMDSLDSDFYVEVVIKVTRRYITSNLSVFDSALSGQQCCQLTRTHPPPTRLSFESLHAREV